MVITAPVVPPYFEERYVKSIEGIECDTYIDWLSLGYIISVTGCPAISLPCGVNADGLPVGMQIIAAQTGKLNYCNSRLG